LIDRGIGLVYWYGYDGPGERAWAFHTLSQDSDAAVWCGDVMVASPDVEASDGDLGEETTPGTGFGVVCANISQRSIDACRLLGGELAAAYRGVPLPDGSPGYLDFRVWSSGDRHRPSG
jgi:hypothetical protein